MLLIQMLIANECKGKSSVWDLYRMIHSAHVSVHSHRACILHRLALILEPVTCQEVSTCRVLTVSQSQTLLLDVRGCTAESVPCDGEVPVGTFLRPPPKPGASGLHVVTTAL